MDDQLRGMRRGGSRTTPKAALSRVLVAVLVILLAIACTQQSDIGRPSHTASPVRSHTPAASGDASSPAIPSGLTAATVTRVVDGDTVVVSIGGQEYKLRYIGVDTPETVDPRRPVGCFGKEASARNRELVEGQSVGLEKDVSETDDFGRLLRYVWLDASTSTGGGPASGGGSGRAEMVNARLIEEGYAQAATYPPDVKYATLFASLQAQARDAGRGLWGPACQPTLTPSPAPGACEYSSTSQPVIKGNISAAGEKIYHVPGGAFYGQTVIDEARGERWFCTEGDALAAGWRKAK